MASLFIFPLGLLKSWAANAYINAIMKYEMKEILN